MKPAISQSIKPTAPRYFCVKAATCQRWFDFLHHQSLHPIRLSKRRRLQQANFVNPSTLKSWMWGVRIDQFHTWIHSSHCSVCSHRMSAVDREIPLTKSLAIYQHLKKVEKYQRDVHTTCWPKPRHVPSNHVCLQENKVEPPPNKQENKQANKPTNNILVWINLV